MILHMRHTLWTGISETNVNFITSATRIHAFNNNNVESAALTCTFICFASHLLLYWESRAHIHCCSFICCSVGSTVLICTFICYSIGSAMLTCSFICCSIGSAVLTCTFIFCSIGSVHVHIHLLLYWECNAHIHIHLLL